jgi:uncharacterized protein (TIGR03435 family)
MRSEQYDINAVAQGKTGRAPPSQAMMNGPMLQALLEDRFKLKVHREARQEPAYLLVMGKDAHKLPPFKEGSCVVPDPNHVPPIFPSPEHPPCDAMVGGRRGPNITVEARRTSVDEFAHLLSLVLDRQVIDKTGIKGTFDIRIAFGVDQTTPRFLPGDMADLPALPSNDPPAPSIFTVVQEQLGLKLEPGKGPREYIVIDHVEKPSEN